MSKCKGNRSALKRGRKGETFAKLYTVDDVILVLGDGDFSFSRGLMIHRGSGLNLFATSFDSEATVRKKYSNADKCILDVRAGQGIVLHEVDATKLDQLPKQSVTVYSTHNVPSYFTYIIFNFPHTGQQRVHINRALLLDFFLSARNILVKAGEVHITLKNRPPYSNWNVEDQAKAAGFVLKERRKFNCNMFPGYHHRTTDPQAKAFDADLCVTYTFVVNRSKFPFEPICLHESNQVTDDNSAKMMRLKITRKHHKHKVNLSRDLMSNPRAKKLSKTFTPVISKRKVIGAVNVVRILWRPWHVFKVGKFLYQRKLRKY